MEEGPFLWVYRGTLMTIMNQIWTVKENQVKEKIAKDAAVSETAKRAKETVF